MTAFVERIGGVLVSPRSTLLRILRTGEGNLGELAFLMVLVSLTVAPVQAGQVFLLLRSSIPAGLSALLSLVANRMAGPILGAIAGAVVLSGVDRIRRGKLSMPFDRSLDACLYALVPFLLLSSLGGSLSELGAELWFMPHRLLRGTPSVFMIRFAVAYAWPLVLFGVLVREVWKEAPDERHA